MSYIDSRKVRDQIVKRLVDILAALLMLLILSPIFMFAALGIITTSPGPVFYKARRMGKGGKVFLMFKFRTMHLDSDLTSTITAPNDRRIFSFGLLLRRLKIDELPQFWNILIGEMSLVGPRPEDPMIVDQNYEAWMRETLQVTPGVTGPGSIYGSFFGNALLDNSDPEGSYVRNLLPPKLALERAYMERARLLSDLQYILLTVWAIFAHILGCKITLPLVDIYAAHRWAPQAPYPNFRT